MGTIWLGLALLAVSHGYYIYIIKGAWGGGRPVVAGRWYSDRRRQEAGITLF